jgi:hypothetical protein
MNNSTSLFAAAIASLVAGLCIATSSNAQSTTSEAAYCQSLVKAYSMGHGARGFSPVSNDTAVAIAQCQEGNPEPAIPVLEQKLRDADIGAGAELTHSAAPLPLRQKASPPRPTSPAAKRCSAR